MDCNTLITAEECKIILNRISPSGKFFTYSVRSLAEEVEGYISSHYALTIRYVENNQSKSKTFFMKKIAQYNGFLPEIAKDLDLYSKENFLYKIYTQLETLNNFQHFAPKCYYQNHDLLILDNLSDLDYSITDRNTLYNLDECKSALKTLARYHSAFIAYEEQQTVKLNRTYRLNLEYPKEFEDKIYSLQEDSSAGKFFQAMKNLVIDLADVIQDDSIDKSILKDRIMKEWEDPNKLECLKRFRQCPIHADLWSKNIMFKRSENVITDCKLIDFQLLRYYLPSFDVILLLSYNTSYKFRQVHKEELIQYYYECLDRQLESYGVNCSKIIPYQDLLDGVVLSEPAAKLQAFNDAAMLRLPEELLLEAMDNPELFKKILTEKKSEYVIQVYHANSEFKQYCIEEILELYEALEQKQYYISNNTLL